MNKARKPDAADRERIVQDENCCRRNCRAARHLSVWIPSSRASSSFRRVARYHARAARERDAFASRLLDPPLLMIYFLANQKPGIQMLLKLVW